MIVWACQRAGQLGNHWDLINVWTDNLGLHRYYEQNGFRHVRTLDLADCPSDALFQRPAIDPRIARGNHRLTDASPRTARHPTARPPVSPRRRCRVQRIGPAAGPHHRAVLTPSLVCCRVPTDT